MVAAMATSSSQKKIQRVQQSGVSRRVGQRRAMAFPILVGTIIIVGLWTNYVVEATARHASDMGYRVFLVSDACASNTIENHEFTIKNILPTLCYVVGTKDLQAALK